ncbi:fructosamine kinase family protein [Marinospirillum sp.]|uniref:fructosamine kinase family protein n=1 Tax=Marinospirillum sp. TaxID=2183934 RepID=UPI00384D32E7
MADHNAYCLWQDLLTQATGQRFVVQQVQPLGGGCINQAAKLLGRDGRVFFVKSNNADQAPVLAAEARALQALQQASGLRVPEVMAWGSDEDQACLLLEALDLQPLKAAGQFGELLAEQHATQSEAFGWHEDNWIGETPQPNRWRSGWVNFWREERLGYQMKRAVANKAPTALLTDLEKLQDVLPAFFSTYQPVPSLVHGDLWSGNWAADEQGRPVVFDPAVYYGDREVDLAMTELFGGPGEAFYAAYESVWPLDAGYPLRKQLYNLYHLLNHFNMFGGGYDRQAHQTVRRLLAEVA